MVSPRRVVISLLLAVLCAGPPSAARAGEAVAGFAGDWVANHELSDDPDAAVEDAIRAAGGRPDSGDRKGRGRYRGGPEEQELYDRITYDDVLGIRIDSPEIVFTYADGYTRTFYTDGRGRSISARGESRDYSFGDWDDGKLYVESVPRDGGHTREVYSLQDGGSRLRVELELLPLNFSVPIKLVRIYDRQNGDRP